MSLSAHGLDFQGIISFLEGYKATHPEANKAEIEAALVTSCRPAKERSVFVLNGFALRLCEANTPSFSNVVLSLSALQKYDRVPFIICIIRPGRLDFRLANTTFLRRVSHSSHKLRLDNVRGSFLGHDIIADYEGVPNIPERFDELFAVHREFTWEDNLARLVESTNAIVARSTRFALTDEVLTQVLEAPNRASAVVKTAGFESVEQDLSARITSHHDELLRAAALDNVNLRGNGIEQILTGGINGHRLDDLIFPLASYGQLIVDIKTKLLDRASSPKAYNIDKMLQLLADPGTSYAFFFVGLDAVHWKISTRLVSIFDPLILKATRVQTHWAGRQSRGVTQLTGDIIRIFAVDYVPSVDIEGGRALLESFAER